MKKYTVKVNFLGKVFSINGIPARDEEEAQTKAVNKIRQSSIQVVEVKEKDPYVFKQTENAKKPFFDEEFNWEAINRFMKNITNQ
jgi:hypothetical protein